MPTCSHSTPSSAAGVTFYADYYGGTSTICHVCYSDAIRGIAHSASRYWGESAGNHRLASA